MPRLVLPEWARGRLAVGVVVTALLTGGLAVAFSPTVRARVAREANRRGLLVTVGHVRPVWVGVALEDVTVVPEGTTGVSAALDEVRLEFDGLTLREVVVHGGHVNLQGDVVAELANWRLRHPAGGGAQKVTPIIVGGATLDWEAAIGDPAASMHVDGLAIRRDAEGTHVTVASLVGQRPHEKVTFAAVSGTVSGGMLRNAHVTSAQVGLEVGPPLVVRDDATKPRPSEMFRPLPLPDLHLARAALENVARRLRARVPDGAHFTLDQLTMEVTRGEEKLDLGPGTVAMDRSGSELHVDFSAGADAPTPLTLRATLPLESGGAVVGMSGGPVTLSMLGVRDGAFGLADPEHAGVRGSARIALDEGGRTLTFDGDIAVSGLSLHEPRLASETVRGLDVRVAARGVLDDSGTVRLDDAEAQLGALHLRSHGVLEQSVDHTRASLALELPVAGCESLLESIPAALLPHVAVARFNGTLGATGYLSFDTRKIDDLVLKYDIDDLCRTTAVPDELKKDHFDGAFTYAIVDKDGNARDRESGPGSEDWAPLETISPMMQVAVLTTEDGAFFHHHGFNTWAIRSALVADIKAGRFVRGASTITMQLAKNLFLSREKTLSRKLEEIILADYLEHTFHKDEMMELYLNVIEFGPDIYGIRAAARHYFGRKPSELNLAESLFLATLLPKPREAHKMYEKGEVPAHVVATIQQLIDIAHKYGRISDKEWEEAKTETVVLHKEDDPPPTPRPPVTSSQLTGDVWRTGEGDDVWQTN